MWQQMSFKQKLRKLKLFVLRENWIFVGPYALRRFSLVLFSSILIVAQTRDQGGFPSPEIQHSAFGYQLSPESRN